MAVPSSTEVGKFQQLIIKNPLAFVGAVFFLMFGITYFINIRKNNSSEQYWKELYEKERSEKDRLKDELLIKAGYIKDETIKKADSTLREQTQEQATTLLNQSK
jgi:putative Ca2+/H+ antiporter (TMEM165/GDT1 family)